MKRVLWFLLLLPLCAIAQVEVVNESMTCDSSSGILQVGKSNWLRFERLPVDAILSVSEGKIIPDIKDKNRFYIPGAKFLEGRITILKVTSGGKIVFTKNFMYKRLHGDFDSLYSIGSMPLRFGNIKARKNQSTFVCKDSILYNPSFGFLGTDGEIVSFDFTLLRKRCDAFGPIQNQGPHLSAELIKIVKGSIQSDKIFIDNIKVNYSDGSCFNYGPVIFTIKKECTE